MDELVSLLGRERLLLEMLVFRLVELRGLLVAGEGRFLGWAAEEVERATRAVREIELQRALTVSRLADERRVAEEALSLAVLADEAPEPYRSLLAEQRRELRDLVSEVEDHVCATRRLARAGGGAIAETLAGGQLTPAADTRAALGGRVRRMHDGRRTGASPGLAADALDLFAHIDDELRLRQAYAGYHAAHHAADAARLPSLVDFAG